MWDNTRQAQNLVSSKHMKTVSSSEEKWFEVLANISVIRLNILQTFHPASASPASSESPIKKAVKSTLTEVLTFTWDDGLVQYKIDQSYSPVARKLIHLSIADFVGNWAHCIYVRYDISRFNLCRYNDWLDIYILNVFIPKWNYYCLRAGKSKLYQDKLHTVWRNTR